MTNDKKTVSVVVPVYNEIDILDELYTRVNKVFADLPDYTYELVFFDDGSTDGTRAAIEELCEKHREVKAVFYARNFGYLKSTFYCMQQAKGDCAIILHADLQNPPEMIPEFLQKWESGAQVILGVKNKSKENRFMYFLRSVFYFLIIRVFGVKLIAHATEFELFDKSFIDILQQIRTNTPFLRGIVSEYASTIDCVYYTQDARKKGKSKFNLNKYYDFAMCGITQYSTNLPRKIIFGCIIALLLLAAEFFFVFLPSIAGPELINITTALLLRFIPFLLLVLLTVVCILFEYIITKNKNADEKPLIVEEKRINY